VNNLKGLGNKMNIFVRPIIIEQVLYVHAALVFKFLECLVEEKNKFKIVLLL
jgi:hypothetical protein